MEGHSLENEETRPPEYSVYQLTNFDREGSDTPQTPGTQESLPALTEGAGGFRGDAASNMPASGSFEVGIKLDPKSDQTDFGSLQFQRENTLLTNAESYAGSIREEAQLYVRQLRGEVENLNAEAEKRYEEAATSKSEAEAEAARIIAEAQAEVESIRKQARNEGYEAGQEEGLTKRYEEAGGNLEHLEAIMKEIGQFRKRVAFYTEQDGIRLALLIAKKILHAELKVNKKAILKMLAHSLSKLEGKGNFVIWLNPEDHQFALAARPTLKRYLDESQSITFRSKPSLDRGNILIETDREVIDLTFESQFYHLDRVFSQALAERDAVLTQTIKAPPPPEKNATPTPDPATPTHPPGAGDEG
ncbi:MAG: FliH/SctL family protein [bacterium]